MTGRIGYQRTGAKLTLVLIGVLGLWTSGCAGLGPLTSFGLEPPASASLKLH